MNYTDKKWSKKALDKSHWYDSTVSVVFLRALGYYALWVITRSIIVTSLWHLQRALGYYAQIAIIFKFIKLKYSIFKILFKFIFSI